MSPFPQKNHPVINKQFLQSIPNSPGVYQMMTEDKDILYVGKAKNLKKRITSYIRSIGDVQSKTGVMLSKVQHVKTILTKTEKEALILEASLIKKHKPKYNIVLRDDKNYPFIKVTINEKWPRLVVVRRKINDGAKYFGPYSSTSSMWETVHHLNAHFPLRRCKEKTLKKKQRSCLNHQMKKCFAPCIREITEENYQKIVKEVLMFLSGKNKLLVKELTSEMNKAAANLQYEQAATYRDKIKALTKTMEKQVIVSSHNKHQDVFGYKRSNTSLAVSVMFIRNGIINGQQTYFVADSFGDDQHILSEIIRSFYDENRTIPNEIIIPLNINEADLLAEWLSDRRKSKVLIKVPQRGLGVSLITMSQSNAEQILADRKKKELSWQAFSREICKTLQLTQNPHRIICLDISHSSGKQTVGSVVSFIKGQKESKEYRHYKIKSVTGPDDYSAMSELLQRHLKRANEENMMPDLLLVDGGKGQLNIACGVTQTLGLFNKLSVVGIAKEKDDEGEKIFIPNRKNPIKVDRKSPILMLLMNIRDESHRFGITLHRKLRNKETLRSDLDLIPGVGSTRKQALLKTIGSVKKIANADVDQLSRVAGIGQELAKVIWRHFH